ncbi:hypothetical protein KR018_002600 [Drosophila ironensis]|nr:hypothetical protein KR018_002600 [Drosophila ironensis]
MLPAWLTKEYLQPWLQKYCQDDGLKVLNIWAKPATGKGENFVGVMTRIYVDYQQGDGVVLSKSYIVKQSLSLDNPQTEVFVEYNLYVREMDVYEFFLPQMKTILQEAGFRGKLSPDAIVVDRQRDTMILEDLAPDKFVNADRVKLLDVAHTKLVLDMLARFHAAAMILRKRHPEFLTQCFYTHFFSRDKKGYTEVFTGLFRAFLKFINGQPDLQKTYGDRLERLGPHLMERGARAFDVGQKDLQTLIHGDCWTTNVMFQYDDEGSPQTVVALDFQFSNCTSPAIDLHYFFTTSLREEVQEREDELLEHYYHTLKDSLKKLNFQGVFPHIQEFQLQFEQRRFMSLLAHLFKPVMIYNGTEICSDFSSLYKDTPAGVRYQKAIYENESVHRSVKKLLDRLDSKGVLE